MAPRVVAAMTAHCEKHYPEEACGLLVGPPEGARATDCVPCANVQGRLHAEDPSTHPRDARTAYRIDPRDLFELTRRVRDDGLSFKAIFHSHADVGAYFSDEDQRQAAPEMELSIAAFARGEGLSEARVAALLADGRLGGDAAAARVRARVPTYPELVYLVVDVTAGRARGFKGYRWDVPARTYVEVPVAVAGEGT
jgi:proteasome lid subunit RPN8/RPN11